MPAKSKITGVRWNPNLDGQIVSGTRPDWTVKVKNEGPDSCSATVSVVLTIPLIGGTVRYAELTGTTGVATMGQTLSTNAMASNYEQAAAGLDPYTVYASPNIPNGTSDTINNNVVVVGA